MNKVEIVKKLKQIEDSLNTISTFPKSWDVTTKTKMVYTIQEVLSQIALLRIKLKTEEEEIE